MTPLRSLADWTMTLATRLAPPAKAQWLEAMRAEFELTEDGDALGWAAGCLAAAAGWALRRDSAYLLAVAGLVLGQGYLALYAMVAVNSLQIQPFLVAVLLTTGLATTLPVFVLSAWRPDRALLPALGLPILLDGSWLGNLLAELPAATDRGTILAMIAFTLAPSVAGAALGAALARRLRSGDAPA